jgi:hypothetical protein
LSMFNKHGFSLKNFSYSFGTVKNKWIKDYPYGNGFFVFEKK